MTTVRDIVSLALRQAKVIAPGVDPTSDEAEDGLTAFQSMLDLWRTNGMFGRPTVADALPVEIDHEGETRAPFDLMLYEVGGVASIYDRSKWVKIEGLSLDTAAPLAGRGVSGLAAALATSGGFAAMFGGEIDPRIDWLGRNFNGALAGKFGSEQPKIRAEYF